MAKFKPINFYTNTQKYRLLPFKFTELNEKEFLLTNIAGEFLVQKKEIVRELVEHKLSKKSQEFIDLKACHFILDDDNEIALELLAIKVRTRYASLAQFTSLHIFVVTLRCEHSCPYCQVSRQSEDKKSYDMTRETADKALDLVFESPSPLIKIEFQGGEPLLNFELIKYIVLEAIEKNKTYKKQIDFVIATNLALINGEILSFCKEMKIHISTSLDGPEDLHNKNRPRPGRNSYQKTISGINLTRDILGKDQVSALMTTTESSLNRIKEIIDEYLSNGFNGIFLRHLSPYGFAIKTKSFISYSTERWINFYKEGLDYIIDLNKKGIDFREFFACTVLKKMLTSDDAGFVDLMNPSGIGIAAVVYNYDGSVHSSDESRMLSEMGDQTFRLGNVKSDSYKDIFTSSALLKPLEDSFTLSVPMCSDCAYEPYCGSDPVYHHGIHKDYVGKKPESSFCKRNMSIFKYLITKMNSDDFVKDLFIKWANEK